MKKVMKHLARKWHHKLGVPCCCLLLAAFLTSLATMHQGRLLSHGRNWQLHALLSPIFCPLSKKAQPRHAKCVRQVARGKQQHGTENVCLPPGDITIFLRIFHAIQNN